MNNFKKLFTLSVVLAVLYLSGIAAAQDSVSTGSSGPAIAVEDIQPYNGPIDASNPLYGLRISMENLDESFTFNQTERLNKELNHARLRIADVRRELILNRTDSAERALEQYWQKVNLTENTLAPLSNSTRLLHAQEEIAKHGAVLENLLLAHPNNTGLMRAYNNSVRLEQRFEQKTATRFDRIMEKNNRTILKAIRLELRDQGHHFSQTFVPTPKETVPEPTVTQAPDMNATIQHVHSNGNFPVTAVETKINGKPVQDTPGKGNGNDKDKGNSPDK